MKVDDQPYRQPKPTPSAPVSFLNISIAVPIGLETIEVSLEDMNAWLDTVELDFSDLSDHNDSPPSSARALKDGA